jgi:hypothetical protein
MTDTDSTIARFEVLAGKPDRNQPDQMHLLVTRIPRAEELRWRRGLDDTYVAEQNGYVLAFHYPGPGDGYDGRAVDLTMTCWKARRHRGQAPAPPRHRRPWPGHGPCQPRAGARPATRERGDAAAGAARTARGHGGHAYQPPRCRWPLETLLADRPWWDEWLPLLGELMGRNLEYDQRYSDRQARPIVDDRGFADLMGYLFPAVTDPRGQLVPWHSCEYGHQARAARNNSRANSVLHQRPVRAEVWEPVVRHVARALTALEMTSQAPDDAYAHLRVQAEIRGEWMRTLAAIVGAGIAQRPGHLPRDPLP